MTRPDRRTASKGRAATKGRAPQVLSPRALTESVTDCVAKARADGIALPEGVVGPLVEFLSLLLEWSERVNLVSRRDLPLVVEKHLAPSLGPLMAEPLAALDPTGRPRLLDVGSGGGFPGLVLGIVRPAWSVVLVESIRKKTLFLAAAAARRANVRVLHARVETLAGDPGHAGRYDLITARAVGAPAVIWPMVRDLLAPGGETHVFSARRGASEAEDLVRSRFDDVRLLPALTPAWYRGVIIRMAHSKGR